MRMLWGSWTLSFPRGKWHELMWGEEGKSGASWSPGLWIHLSVICALPVLGEVEVSNLVRWVLKITVTGHGLSCFQCQHFGGWGRSISSLRPAWGTSLSLPPQFECPTPETGLDEGIQLGWTAEPELTDGYSSVPRSRHVREWMGFPGFGTRNKGCDCPVGIGDPKPGWRFSFLTAENLFPRTPIQN
jgi:hypothetical protein